jgi:hypothetical protein
LPLKQSELSPYLIKGRLADIIAALQVMAAATRPEAAIERWTDELSRSKNEYDMQRWTKVFIEHPEFFLTYKFDNQLKAALRWRYVNKLYDPKTGTEYTPQEKEALPREQRWALTTRPLGGEQVSTLLNTAIELHSRAVAEQAASRWWIPILTAVLGFIGAVAGAMLTSLFGPHK